MTSFQLATAAVVVLTQLVPQAETEMVYASSAEIQLLNEGERNLTKVLNGYIQSEHERLARLWQLVNRVTEERDKQISDGTDNVLIHPLDIYSMIRRFETDWLQINQLVFSSRSLSAYNESLTALTPFLPNQADFDGARLAMVRLQSTYKLPIKDMLNGLVAGRQSQPLSQQDALLIALKAVNSSHADEAIEWLTAAFEHKQEPHVTDQQLHHALAKAYAAKQDYLTSVEHVRKAIELDPKNSSYLKDIVNDFSIPYHFIANNQRHQDIYFSMCRQFASENDRKSEIGLKDDQTCILRWNRNMPFRRIKVEHISRSHEIVLFHDFVTDRESQMLQSLAMKNLRRAQIGGRTISEIRVGKVSWLNESTNTFLQKINSRISDFTGLDLRTAEFLQLSNYGIGGHYSIHHDSFGELLKVQADSFRKLGDRIATVMIYLTEVEAGGGTVFPVINVGTRPVKNAAVFWYNYNRRGEVNLNMFHGGCPVLIGEKWVANKWIRENGQEFRRPCEPIALNV